MAAGVRLTPEWQRALAQVLLHTHSGIQRIFLENLIAQVVLEDLLFGEQAINTEAGKVDLMGATGTHIMRHPPGMELLAEYTEEATERFKEATDKMQIFMDLAEAEAGTISLRKKTVAEELDTKVSFMPEFH